MTPLCLTELWTIASLPSPLPPLCVGEYFQRLYLNNRSTAEDAWPASRKPPPLLLDSLLCDKLYLPSHPSSPNLPPSTIAQPFIPLLNDLRKRILHLNTIFHKATHILHQSNNTTHDAHSSSPTRSLPSFPSTTSQSSASWHPFALSYLSLSRFAFLSAFASRGGLDLRAISPCTLIRLTTVLTSQTHQTCPSGHSSSLATPSSFASSTSMPYLSSISTSSLPSLYPSSPIVPECHRYCMGSVCGCSLSISSMKTAPEDSEYPKSSTSTPLHAGTCLPPPPLTVIRLDWQGYSPSSSTAVSQLRLLSCLPLHSLHIDVDVQPSTVIPALTTPIVTSCECSFDEDRFHSENSMRKDTHKSNDLQSDGSCSSSSDNSIGSVADINDDVINPSLRSILAQSLRCLSISGLRKVDMDPDDTGNDQSQHTHQNTDEYKRQRTRSSNNSDSNDNNDSKSDGSNSNVSTHTQSRATRRCLYTRFSQLQSLMLDFSSSSGTGTEDLYETYRGLSSLSSSHDDDVSIAGLHILPLPQGGSAVNASLGTRERSDLSVAFHEDTEAKVHQHISDLQQHTSSSALPTPSSSSTSTPSSSFPALPPLSLRRLPCPDLTLLSSLASIPTFSSLALLNVPVTTPSSLSFLPTLAPMLTSFTLRLSPAAERCLTQFNSTLHKTTTFLEQLRRTIHPTIPEPAHLHQPDSRLSISSLPPTTLAIPSSPPVVGPHPLSIDTLLSLFVQLDDRSAVPPTLPGSLSIDSDPLPTLVPTPLPTSTTNLLSFSSTPTSFSAANPSHLPPLVHSSTGLPLQHLTIPATLIPFIALPHPDLISQSSAVLDSTHSISDPQSPARIPPTYTHQLPFSSFPLLRYLNRLETLSIYCDLDTDPSHIDTHLW